MKLFLHTLAIAALSVCSIHTVSAVKQPVRASKKDPLDEREVTVKIMGSKGPKKPISSSTFKTDTSGLLTGKLSFDFLNGIPDRGEDGNINTILAVYTDKPREEFSISVSQKDVPKGSEIKIGSNAIEIDTSKAQNKKPTTKSATVVATVQIPANSGQWRIITGNNDLKKARTVELAKEVRTRLHEKANL